MRHQDLAMDITEDDSMSLGIDQILAETGRIDVLVNNAGYGSYGAVEDVPLEEARRQFEVNVFGAARLIQLLMPTMRARSRHDHQHHLHGRQDLHALRRLVSRHQVRPRGIQRLPAPGNQAFGIDVVVIEPGAIGTEWAGIAADHLVETSGKAPTPKGGPVPKSSAPRATAKRASPPEVIAKTIVKAATARRPRPATPSGRRQAAHVHAPLAADRTYDSMILRVGGVR